MIEKLIDLRSDTVTKPSPEMREAMFNAIVGDDVFDEDPTVNALEEKAAKLFGHEAALFCPSGTMTNQIAIKILTQPQQEVICDRLSHIYYAEGGGVAFNSGVSMCLVDGDRGRISASHVADNVNPPQNIQQPLTSLVAVENTNNKGGGSCYTMKQLSEVATEARKHNLKLHLDGARIFNAVVETKDSTQEIGKLFDTISVCLSKGLGAPVGSLLITSKENLNKAKRVRKVFGGGMRQSGFLAAAGIYALDNNVEKLKEDHRRAKNIEMILKELNYVDSCLSVETNIIMFKLDDKKSVPDFLNYLSKNNIKGYQFGKQTVRFVTHLDFTDSMLEKLNNTLKNY